MISKYNLQNIICHIFIIFIVVPKIDILARRVRSCPISDLQFYEYKVFCESEKGISINCLENSNQIKKIYLSCNTGYYNEDGMTQQIIHCTEKGRWTDTPMECIPECVPHPESIELINVTELTFPTSYVEIVRETPEEGKINVFPAIIINERNVITKLKYVENEMPIDFLLRIYKSPTFYIDTEIYSFSINLFENKKLDYDKVSLVFLYFLDHIAYDKDTKPACFNLTDIPEFEESKFLLPAFTTKNLIAQNSRSCVVPHVDNTQIDMTCISSHHKKQLIDCSKIKSVDTIKTRCQIGYFNSKLDKYFDNNLSYCHLNRWLIFGKDKDCQAICGQIDKKNEIDIDPETLSGSNVDIISAPWHVGIFIVDPNEGPLGMIVQICGGSIIHSNIVVSAAHCFYDPTEIYDGIQNASDYLIGAGKRYRSHYIVEDFQQYAGVQKIHIPPHYKPHSVENDIAVLILNRYFEFTSHVKPVCVDWETYEDYNIDEEINGRIFGWGKTSVEEISSNELRVIELKTMSNYDCKKRVGPRFRAEITGDRFCAVNDYNVTGCQGDSGGGYVVKQQFNGYSRYCLKGIVSIGVDRTTHCSGKSVTVFTNVQYYQDILKRIISRSRNEHYQNLTVI